MTRKIKVLVVDDSAVARQLLSSHLARDPAIEIVGTAADPYLAWEKMRTLEPDVLTLDVEMPRMDGITFLEKLMQRRPTRVLMVSSLTEAGCTTTLRALELGAIDFVTKPLVGLREGFGELAQEIVEKVKIAAAARLPVPRPVPAARRLRSAGAMRTTQRIIAIGASTGGTEAIREFLTVLPADAPGIVIVQHMPEKFTRGFAARLDGLCAVRVKEAADGDRALAGHVLVAPGNRHMRLVRDGTMYLVRLSDEPYVNRHRPSVDVLFHSCAQTAGANAVGILMTGMGDDGARGLLALRQAGAATLAQDEATCVVFGMPRMAIELGAAEQVLPLGRLADVALTLAQDPPVAAHGRGT